MLNGSPTTALARMIKPKILTRNRVRSRRVNIHSQFSQQGGTYTTSLKCGSAQVVFLYRAIFLEVCCQNITQDCLDWTVSPFLLLVLFAPPAMSELSRNPQQSGYPSTPWIHGFHALIHPAGPTVTACNRLSATSGRPRHRLGLAAIRIKKTTRAPRGIRFERTGRPAHRGHAQRR